MFESVEAVAPGEWLTIGEKGLRRESYFELKPALYANYTEGLEALDEALRASMQRRLRADTDIGILLSGGIDSTILASLMRDHDGRKIHAMTYEAAGRLSEVEASAEVALKFGFEHHVVRPRPLLERISTIVRSLEQPLGDSIVFAMDDLFAESRKHMKVVLSGEGADEIFAGYAHHQVLRRWDWIRDSLGHAPLRAGAKVLRWVPMPLLQRLLPYPAKLNESARTRATALLETGSIGEAHRLSSSLMSSIEADGLLLEAEPRESAEKSYECNFADVLRTDLRHWLPNYGLSRTDRLSMAYGLECRVPYLSHEVAEAAMGLTLRFGGSPLGGEKRPLRDWAKKASPKLSLPRKKPFHLPLRENHEKSFLEACESYLNPTRIERAGLLSVSEIQNLRSRPLDFLQEKKLTSLILLQAWHDQWVG